MRTNIFSIIFLLVVIVVTTSCSDAFLEPDPVNAYTEETFYQTDEQMYAALAAAYAPLRWNSIEGSTITLGEIRSDNAVTGGGSPTDNIDMQSINNFTNTEVNILSEAQWEKNYACIYRSNLILNAEYNSEVTKVYKAEAHFLRAWAYFDLLRIYGPCVLVEETAYPESESFERNTREEIYQYIENELIEAIKDLEIEHDSQNIGRITKGAAQALLGKMYIYKASWNNNDPMIFDKAVEPLQAIIDGGKYTLFDDYSQLFRPFQENNSESVFEIQYSTLGDNSNNNQGTGNHFINHYGMRGLNGHHPELYTGWGFCLPQQELWDYFLEDDTIRRNASAFTYDEVVTDYNASRPEGSKEVTWDIARYNQEAWEGFASKKYTKWKGYTVIGKLNKNLAGNIRVIRYGEVYLMLAEALLRGTTKNEDKAKELINTLREKRVVTLPGETSYRTVDDMIAQYAQFSSVLDVLWYERRVELAGEGDRWHDLVRRQKAREVTLAGKYAGNWNDNDIYIPISITETSASGGSLTPYPEE